MNTPTPRKRSKAKAPATSDPEPSPDVVLFRTLHEALHSLTFNFDFDKGEFQIKVPSGFLRGGISSTSAVSFRAAALSMLSDILPLKIERLEENKNQLAKAVSELEALKVILEQEKARGIE